jgi:outer membrane protein OmpA-like peptidoglycan-associated protein
VPGTQTTPAPPDLVVPMADRSAVQSQIDHLTAMRPITFAPNSTALTPTGVTTVTQIAEILRSTPTARIEVDGHVASTPGREPDPQVLSDHRAVAVRAQLVRLGVAADRISAVGLGDTKPVAGNTTAQGRAANRRAEIVVR